MIAEAEFTTSDTSASTDSISSQLFDGFADSEYRHVYAEEHLNTFIPFQIRAIREQRGWTQEQLGKECGKAQGWISTLEDPNYGKLTLTTLKQLARAFDCMLDVRFVSFKNYSTDQERRRAGDLRVNSYNEDAAPANAQAPPANDTTASNNRIAWMNSATEKGTLQMAKANATEPPPMDQSDSAVEASA